MKKPLYVFSFYKLGVGNMTNPKELARLASKPTEQFMFEVNGYEALPKIKDILAFKTCEGNFNFTIFLVAVPAVLYLS